MTDWMTIRVVLTGREDVRLVQPPGRVLLVHADHSFADLGDAIDTAFARWDLTPLHEFGVEGRRLAAEPEEADVEDSDEVTVGEVGLRPGSRFTYLFDLAARWMHDCTVEEVGVDPYELTGEEPDLPAAVLGWGTIPDQHGRHTEHAVSPDQVPEFEDLFDELFEDFDMEAELAAWDEAEAASWEIVAKALTGIERPLQAEELAAVTVRVRTNASEPGWPYDVLLAAGGLADAQLPADDQQLWLELASGVVSPRDDTPLDAEVEASWYSLELADWAGAVIGLVRGGVGHSAEPEELIRLIETCPEVEAEEADPDDNVILVTAFETVVSLWEALGAVDSYRRLTALGLWGLPEALRLAWTG
ncbi:MAG: IS1096 element passenger TnpR family protein [Egibacteraceae bacterium]